MRSLVEYVYEPMRGSLLVVPSLAVGMSMYCTGAFENQIAFCS